MNVLAISGKQLHCSYGGVRGHRSQIQYSIRLLRESDGGFESAVPDEMVH